MKHLKTFESYQSVNEEFIGKFLRNIYSKVKNAFRGWRDRLQRKAAMKIAEIIDDNKDNPNFQEALSKIRSEYDKLPQSDKDQLQRVLRQGELEDMVSESKITDKILGSAKLLGASSAVVGFVSMCYSAVMHALYMPQLDSGIHTTWELADLANVPKSYLMGLSHTEWASIAALAIFGGMIVAGVARTIDISREEIRGRRERESVQESYSRNRRYRGRRY